MDLFKIRELAASESAEYFQGSLDEYFMVVEALVAILRQQVEMNWESLHRLQPDRAHQQGGMARERFIQAQHQAYVNAFVIMGLTNATFVDEIDLLFPGSRAQFAAKAMQLSVLYPAEQCREAG